MTDQQQEPTLYGRLGGHGAVCAFAGEVLKTCMKHPDIDHIWVHVFGLSFQRKHINFIGFLYKHWGGNAVYRGRDMVTAHRGMGLTEVHWRAIFEAIDECYENFDVLQDIREEIVVFLTQFGSATIGSPPYQDVVPAHSDTDVIKGMKGVGIHWPKTDKPS